MAPRSLPDGRRLAREHGTRRLGGHHMTTMRWGGGGV
jgi:hypothetical protein